MKYKLTEKQKKYVKMLYEGELSLTEMAASLGVHRTTLWRWEKNPEIRERIESYFRSKNERFLRKISDDHQREMERLDAELDAEPDAERRFTTIQEMLDRSQAIVMGDQAADMAECNRTSTHPLPHQKKRSEDMKI